MSIEAANPRINATLTASAGSGKTWMLVTRIVRLLLDGAEPGSILALTFTRKAAAEMQQRLSERLYEMAIAEDNELDKQLAEIGLKADDTERELARRLYEMHQYCDYPVRTQTFHSFCQDILSRFALEADVPPGFDLLESSSLLIQQAQDALFNEAAKNMQGELAQQLQQLMQACDGLYNLSKILNNFLDFRSDWWAYTEGQQTPCAYATEQLAQQLQLDNSNLDGDGIYADFFKHYINDIKTYARLLAQHGTKTNLGKAQRIADALADEVYNEAVFNSVACELIKKDGAPYALKDSAALRKKLGDDNADQLLELHPLIAGRILDTQDKINRIKTLELNRLWYQCGERFVEHYQNLKQELRLLDFTDLEWHSYKLLKDAENTQWIQYKLDQQIKHFLIDEFQDTNPTQWQLILPLLEEMAASEHTDRSVFLVGDEKQSIYSFRRAKPELQAQAARWLEQHLNAKAFPLNKSWRSSPVIIDAVNRVFETEKYQSLIRDFKAHETHRQDLYGKVVLLPEIRSEKNAPEDEEQELVLRNPLLQPREEKSSLYTLEGQQIARAIRELINNKATTGPEDNARLIDYNDIYILVRKRSHVAAYEEALQQAGIPYIGANKGSFLDCLEIQDMLALLDSLISPFNNLSLAQVLKSPIFDASDNDLITLASLDNTPLWIERLAILQDELPEPHTLRRAHDYLQQWRALADKIPVHDLLNQIYADSQLLMRYQAASPESLKPRVEANLIRFMELALDLDSGRYPSLMHFLQHLRSLKALSDAPDEAPAEAAESRVKIMTIHASKGLEAPVIFMADTINIEKDRSSLSTLVDWPVDQPRPCAFQLIPSTKNRDRISSEKLEWQKKVQERENANLLYVAMTRARQYLYISACRPERGSLNNWYQDISAALNHDDNEDDILQLQSEFPMPSCPPRETATQTDKPINLDKRLFSTHNIQYSGNIIAPSQFNEQPDEASKTATLDEDAMLRGIGIHRLLELINTRAEIDDQQLIQIVSAELQLSADNDQLTDWLNEVRELLDNAQLKAVFYPQNSSRVWNEIPIHYPRKNKMVYGIIDRLIVTDDCAWIIDYKSHQHAQEDTLAAIAQSYQKQMQYYAVGIKKAWPDKAIRASLLFTACGLLQDMEL